MARRSKKKRTAQIMKDANTILQAYRSGLVELRATADVIMNLIRQAQEGGHKIIANRLRMILLEIVPPGTNPWAEEETPFYVEGLMNFVGMLDTGRGLHPVLWRL